jgi:uncharacterized protein YbjT (DUF2867 family)
LDLTFILRIRSFESKRLAEKHLKEKHPTLPTTILRPVTFMDEFIPDDPDSATARLTKLILLTQLKPTTRVQCVACSDIGGVAALVLAHPDRYIGKDFDIAGESLAPKDFEDGWREVFGEELRPKMIGGNTLAWAVRTGKKELRLMFKVRNCAVVRARRSWFAQMASLCAVLQRGRV